LETRFISTSHAVTPTSAELDDEGGEHDLVLPNAMLGWRCATVVLAIVDVGINLP
jgi:hypothetical protein